MAGPERVTRLDVLERLPLDTIVADTRRVRWTKTTPSQWVSCDGVSRTSKKLFIAGRPLRVVERPVGLF